MSEGEIIMLFQGLDVDVEWKTCFERNWKRTDEGTVHSLQGLMQESIVVTLFE